MKIIYIMTLLFLSNLSLRADILYYNFSNYISDTSEMCKKINDVFTVEIYSLKPGAHTENIQNEIIGKNISFIKNNKILMASEARVYPDIKNEYRLDFDFYMENSKTTITYTIYVKDDLIVDARSNSIFVIFGDGKNRRRQPKE